METAAAVQSNRPPQPFFCAENRPSPPNSRGKAAAVCFRRSPDLCLERLTCLPSRNAPMTGFHQRQAVSTLTVPAAWGLAPRSLVQPDSLNAPSGHGNINEIVPGNNAKMAIACSTNGQNIAMTIPKQHSDETVGLPTRASSKICPAFSGCPNDWLSPTDRFLNAHGIGQCGASRTL